MKHIDTTPGLRAWETRRRKRRQQWTHRAILLTGVVGAGLYVTPLDYNPLVQSGILLLPQATPAVAIPQISLAIAVDPSNLPKHRPSLSAARSIDQIEVAHVINVLGATSIAPQTALLTASPAGEATFSAQVDHDGSSEPMLAWLTPPPEQPATATLSAPRKATQPATKPQASKVEPEEDMAAFRKRIFTPAQ